MDNNKIPQKQHTTSAFGVNIDIERLQKSMDGEKQEMLPIRCLTHDPSVKSSLN
jgi:uncharacterized protein (DUF2132 family)